MPAEAAGALWAETTRGLYDYDTIEQAQQGIVRLARFVVRGSEFAGLTLLTRDGRLSSPAYSDPVVLKLDRLQNELGEGPCLEALSGPPALLLIADTSSEQRWARFALCAHELGIGSLLACTLPGKRGARMVLQFHATHRAALDAAAAQVAAVYAEHAALALAAAGEVESLERSAASRQVIGEATGILMERHQADSRTAFNVLVKASQRLNIKLREIAEVIVRTGQNPDELRTADFPGGG